MRSNIARTCPASSRPARLPGDGHACAYLSWRGNSTIAVNFCGGRFLNDGIGAVGSTSVRAIARRGSRAPDVRQVGAWARVAVLPILWHAAARLRHDLLALFVFGELRTARLDHRRRRGHFDDRRRAALAPSYVKYPIAKITTIWRSSLSGDARDGVRATFVEGQQESRMMQIVGTPIVASNQARRLDQTRRTSNRRRSTTRDAARTSWWSGWPSSELGTEIGTW